MEKHQYVVVVGAGPIGLAAAAHLVAANVDVAVLEAGESPAHTIRDWAHVRLFTDWASLIDPVAGGMLEEAGWTPPPAGEFPIGGELIAGYLEPLAELLGDRVQYGHEVTAITRSGKDKLLTAGREEAPFVVRAATSAGITEWTADHVIDASGTWLSPNPMGSGGLPAIGEESANTVRYGIPDVLGAERDRYAEKRVLVVGAGHSAANALLDLAELALTEVGTEPMWAIRRPTPDKAYGQMEEDELPQRGKVGVELRQLVEAGQVTLVSDFRVKSVEASSVVGVDSSGAEKVVPVDEIVVATGQRPNLEMTRELRLELDPALEAPVRLAPLIDPNVHSCLTVPAHGVGHLAHPEAGFYTVGIKSYGRAPTFLMATGYKQVESVVSEIVG